MPRWGFEVWTLALVTVTTVHPWCLPQSSMKFPPGFILPAYNMLELPTYFIIQPKVHCWGLQALTALRWRVSDHWFYAQNMKVLAFSTVGNPYDWNINVPISFIRSIYLPMPFFWLVAGWFLFLRILLLKEIMHLIYTDKLCARHYICSHPLLTNCISVIFYRYQLVLKYITAIIVKLRELVFN